MSSYRGIRLLSALVSVALVLSIALVSPAAAVPVTVLTQDFTSATFPPTGWSEFHGPKWTREANCTQFTTPSACATITGPGTEKFGLMTPPFNVSALTNPKVDFDVFISDPDATASFKVMDAWDCGGFDGPSPPGTVHDPAGPSPVSATGLSHQSLPVAVRPNNYCLMFMFEQRNLNDPTDPSSPPAPAPATVKIDNVVISGDGPAPPPNDPPIAPAAVTFPVTEDTPTTLNFSGANIVRDPNGDALTLVQTSGPFQGSISDVSFLPGGMSLKYTPNVNFDGERNAAGNVFRGDEFKFKVNDGQANSIETTVTIDMTAVNDAPQIEGPDSVSILQDQPWFAFSNGVPGGGAHCTNVGCSATPDVPLGVSDDAPGYPTATGHEVRMIIETQSAAGGKFSLGQTSGLTFSQGDGTADQRMVFTGLWFAIDTALNAGATYTPAPGYVGSDTLRLVIDDQGEVGLGGAKSAEKLIPITIGAINHPPTADSKSMTVLEDGSAGVTLTGNDPDGNPLTFNVVTPPAHGALTGTKPNLTYVPDPNFSGNDSFTYTSTDGEFTSFFATVSITVNPLTDPPVIADLTFSAIEDQTKQITLSPQSNLDNVPITWEVGPPSVGALSSNGVTLTTGLNTLSSPTLTFTPQLNYNGPVYFLFRARATIDGAPFLSGFKQGLINVQNVNDPPEAGNQVLKVKLGASVPFVLDVKDVDGDPLTFRFLNQPQVGQLTGTAPNLTYTAPNFGWHTSFTYEVSDGIWTDFGSVEIKVTNDQPDATIRLASETTTTPLGYNVYNEDATGQTLSVDAPPGKPTDIEVVVWNGNFFADKFLVTGSGGPQGWDIKYLVGGQDVSAAVYNGKEFDIAANRALVLTMRVTPGASQAGERFKALVTAKSLAADGGSDVVAADVRSGTFKPDVLVSESGRLKALGNDVYNTTGSLQTIEQRGATDQTVYSHFYVENDGTAVDDFVIKGDVAPGAKWLRQISNDTDVTSLVDAGTYKVGGLLPGQVADILLVYKVPEGTTGLKTFHLTATSVAKGSSDTAIANIDTFGAGQPDLILESDQRNRSEYGNYTGGGSNIYNSDGAGQTSYELLPVGASNVYAIHFENDADYESLFDVRTGIRACLNIDCSKPPSAYGLQVKFWELNPRTFAPGEGNREITSSILAGQQREGPARNLVDRYWLEVISDQTTPVNVNIVVNMTARAVGDPTKEDKVIVDLRTVKFRPDVEVSGFKGTNVYNSTADNQTVDVNLGSKDTQEVTFTVENDPLGNTLQFQDRMLLNATPGSNGFTVRYLGPNGGDITSEVTSYGYPLRLGPLQKATFKAVITSPSKANAGLSLALRFTATSLTSSWTNNDTIGTPGPVDVGGANVKVAYRPDVAVAANNGLTTGPFTGDGVYDPLVGPQELAADAKMLNTKKYTVKLSNDGPAADTLKASLDGKTDGFVIKVLDGTTDVTAALRAGTYSASLPAGGSKDLSVTVRPGERASEGSRLAATFTVKSQTRPLSEPDAARIVTTAVITCDETDITVGVVNIEGACIMKTDTGYLSQQDLVLNGVELYLFGPPAIIDTARQRLSTDMAEMRFADYDIDTVVRIPVTLDFVVKTRCDEYLYADDWRNGASTCATAGAQYVGEPLGLSAGEWSLTGSVNHLGQEPWGWVFGDRLPTDENPSWQYVLEWMSGGGVKVDVPVPAPEDFHGAPAELPLTLGNPPPRYVEVDFGTLNIQGIPIFTFLDSKYRHYLDTGERLLYGRVGFPGIPALTGFQFGAKFESGGTPEWIFAKLRAGQTESLFPILPPHVYLDQATFVIEPQGPAVMGTVEADVWKLLTDGGTGGSLPGFLMSMKGSLAYEQQRVSARGEMYLLGVIGPLADAKVTAGSGGVRASMNWNYSVGIGSINFGGSIGTLDLGRLGIDALLDGSGSGKGFEVLGSGTLHVLTSNVGLKAVISSLGAAGCATANIASLGSGEVGVGVKWNDGGSPSLEFLSNCSLSGYKDPDAPQHVNFDGFSTRFKSYLAEADQIDALMQSLPEAVSLLGL